MKAEKETAYGGHESSGTAAGFPGSQDAAADRSPAAHLPARFEPVHEAPGRGTGHSSFRPPQQQPDCAQRKRKKAGFLCR